MVWSDYLIFFYLESQIVNLLKMEIMIESLKNLKSKFLFWKHNYKLLITKMEDLFIYNYIYM